MKFFLALAAIAPAASMVSSRTKSAALAEDSSSPWLSLLTKSWALPGESPEEQNKGLDSLANSIVQLARNHEAPDASMQAALDSIKQILKDMKDAVMTANGAAQQEIFKKQGTLAACAVPNTTGVAAFQDSNKTTSADVVACRLEENGYYDGYQHCIAEEARCANTTECCAQVLQPNQYCLSQPVAPTPLTFSSACDAASKCREKDLQNKLGFFEAKLKEYTDAEAACELSRAGCNASYACTEKKTLWNTFRGQCNTKQTSFEQALCDLATRVEMDWETYTTCYAHTKDALVKEEDKQEALLSGRRQEWRGLLRIECLLEALSAADKETALQACITKDHAATANATLELSFPSHTGNISSLATCTQKIEAPGTDHFLKSNYHQVPSVLMPETLNTYHCVSGVATNHCPIDMGSASLLAQAFRVPRVHRAQHRHA
mmetsp:Transcript_14635/g.27474  ORF Transcript_14635/g.27474 Transcript_14635/m.27474 type:complete len:434 (-) Transcript_14635:132-1433(-)